MNNEVLTAALAYAAQGWQVFPLTTAKVPLANCPVCREPDLCAGRDTCTCPSGTCHGFYAATLDEEQIERWFTSHPSWQLGIRTGTESNLAVLDVDVHAGGQTSLADLQRRHGELPGTLLQISGSGTSFHVAYSHPGHRVANSAGRLGAGLDVRGDGGYIVAAPSRHPRTGLPYAWHDDVFDAGRLTAWPEQLTRLTATSRPVPDTGRSVGAVSARRGVGSTRYRLEGVLRFVLASSVGERNARVYWASCRLGEMIREAQLDEATAVEVLRLVGTTLGLTDTELLGADGRHGTVWSGLRCAGAS